MRRTSIVTLITHCFIIAATLACVARTQSVSAAPSDRAFSTTCPFSKGEPVSTVKSFYGIAFDPPKLDRPTPSGTSYQYHFQQYGVWVFFDDRLLINGFRFDEPFAGKIAGIAIGDDQATVRRARGEPSNQFRGLPDRDSLETRKQRRLDILNALPDPAPKEKVMAAFQEIAQIDALPLDWNTAWTYNPPAGNPSFLRYDFSARSGKVQSILANSCRAES